MSRNYIIYKSKICLIAGLVTLVACTDDFLVENNQIANSSELVIFSASLALPASSNTRSTTTPYEPLVLQSDEDRNAPLYLHTYEHPFGETIEEMGCESTRGTQIASPQDLYKVHKSFGVRGVYNGSGDDFIHMHDTRLVTNDDYSYWMPVSPHRWPGNEKIQFSAIAPYSHIENKLVNAVYGENNISFSYTAEKSESEDEDAEAQADLVMAVAKMGRPDTEPYNYRVPLKFHHALSAVKFAVRDVLKGKVISVTVRGIKGQGDCVYTADDNSENGSFLWSNQTGSESYTQIFNHEVEDGYNNMTDPDKDVVLTDITPEKTFMFIPQVLTKDAEIEVILEREGITPAKIKMKGKILDNDVNEWKAGYEYVYTISTSKSNWTYVFDAEGNEAEGIENIYVYSPSSEQFDVLGNNAYFNVKSYRYRTNNPDIFEPLPWSASHDGSLSYKVENSNEIPYPETNPQIKWVHSGDWITDKFETPLRGQGSTSKSYKERHDLEFLSHYVSTDWVGDEVMQGYEPYSGFNEDNPYDLSTFGGNHLRTTANCYIVDRGGWYMFPLVYGNAIKEDQTNTSAYICQNTSTDQNLKLLKTLTDYNDNPITTPYINVDINAYSELIWQDAYDLVDKIELVTIKGEKMIRFYVEPNNLQQGNAIIALKDRSGTVVWSWHIWATEHWIDKNTRLPHVFDTGNSTFNTFKPSAAKTDAGVVIGLRECGDVKVTYNQHGREFWMSPYNLGWCDPKKVIYLKRKSDMIFVQYMPDGTTPTNLSDKLPIIQAGETIDYKYANNTYYQWGRKDPIRGYYNHEHNTKRVFGPRQPSMIKDKRINIGEAIKNPEIFYCSDGLSGSEFEDWLTSNFKSNLWNNHSNTSLDTHNDNTYHEDMWSHTKTVYDPSPAGYMIPNAGVWHVVQKEWSSGRTFSDGTSGAFGEKKIINGKEEASQQRDTWSGGNWALAQFVNKVNGARIDDYNYKVWGTGIANDNSNALFFSSTGNRWWTDGWSPADYNGNAGGNFGRNVSYAWSNRSFVGKEAYGMALGLDTDRLSEGNDEELRYFVGGQFIGRRTMGRPIRAIREP